MIDINKIILIGRLGTNPVQRETKKGTAVVHFSMATSRKLRPEDGEVESTAEETQWHQVVSWGKQAEACALYLKKGYPVYVEGYLKSRKYNDKEGKSRMAFEVHAEHVSFLGGIPTGRAAEVRAEVH